MNVLQINKFHYLRGGSERVYFGTADVLERHGHKVTFFSMVHPENVSCETSRYFMPDVDLNTNDISHKDQIKIALRVLYSSEAKKRLSRLLDRYPIDIAHLHNIHHQISPSILHELKERNIPVVMTLHDYKMVCASYSLMNDEKTCESCCGGKYYKAISQRCIKNSVAKSILATVEMYLHHKLLDIYNNVDLFISPSVFLKNKLKEMGFKKKVAHLPNFVTKFERGDNDADDKENSLVYFGRLSREKGVQILIKAVKQLQEKSALKVKIKIIGDGHLKDVLEEETKVERIDNVQFFGYMRGESLYNEIGKSAAVVLPSEWYENNPISVLEAFALGKPVIGAHIGGIPELVKDTVTGLTFKPGDAGDLAEKITALLSDSNMMKRMGENARLFVEQNFSAERYYQGLIKIYRSATERQKA